MRSYAPSGETIQTAMANRYHAQDGIMARRSYTTIPAQALHGFNGRRVKGVHGLRGGLGDVCDDPGAAIAMSIIGAAGRAIGGAVSAAGTSSKDAGVNAAGTAIGGTVGAVGDAWAAACLSAPRGSSSGATPTESPADAVARANAELEMSIASSRNEELALQNAAAADRNKNIAIGVGVVALVVVAGVVLTRR